MARRESAKDILSTARERLDMASAAYSDTRFRCLGHGSDSSIWIVTSIW